MLTIPALGMLRQKEPKFEASVGYIVSLRPARAAQCDPISTLPPERRTFNN
jgi:hypothetical protein